MTLPTTLPLDMPRDGRLADDLASPAIPLSFAPQPRSLSFDVARPATRHTAPLSLTCGARLAIAGGNTHSIIGAVHDEVTGRTALSGRLGDRASAMRGEKTVWLADWTYVVVPDGAHPGHVRYRSGFAAHYAPETRRIPLVFDSAAFRAEITGMAPVWARKRELYYAAIEKVAPNAFAAPDAPYNFVENRRRLDEVSAAFPQYVADGRLWPVFPSAALATDGLTVNRASLPEDWRRLPSLGALIPLNETQRAFSLQQREAWAYQAIAFGQAITGHPEFRRMAVGGRVMIGGMVKGSVPRIARHLALAIVCLAYPDTQIWGLGQANWASTNGLGVLGMLDRVWLDSTWWLLDSAADRFAAVKRGLITMIRVGSGLDANGDPLSESFATRLELMKINLRALHAAYGGLWRFPALRIEDVNLANPAERAQLKYALLADPTLPAATVRPTQLSLNL